MIGFGHQRTVRRPFYSITGTKIGYIDGEWWTTLDGTRIFKIKRLKGGDVDKHISGPHWITWSEINDNC